ncbi:hypothetical protein [Salinibacter ruber]|jgi:hypothetical protein|uniref:hypothetical protein n=1 Tax=Salinibacter ruber TaxID=146919 RepID=UPI000E56DAFF|nr:hypothetical protein [Salinibacter ruber]
MKDSWIGPLGALLLIGCCLLLETGLIGGGLATGLAALGYSTKGLVVGATLAVLVVAWTYHRRRSGGAQEQDP